MKKQIIQLVDDIDGTVLEAGEGATVRFSLEGKSYEIDLSDANADKLREALAPYVAAGRSIASTVRSSGTKRASRSSGGDLALIRAWAQSNGYSVGDRGRISGEIREAYEAAN